MLNRQHFIFLIDFLSENGLILINAIITTSGFALGSLWCGMPGTYKGLEIKTWGYITLASCTTIVLGITVLIIRQQKSKEKNVTDLSQKLSIASEKVRGLEEEMEKISSDYLELVNDQLGLIYHKLDFASTERITVYKHNQEKGLFVLLGRFSTHPEYYKRRRATYPDNQGFIMKAWHDGEFACNDLPDASQKAKKYYDEVNKISTIPQEVVKDIRMKSRSFYTRAIHHPTDRTRVAVIVIESTRPKWDNLEHIKKVILEEERRLFSFVERVKLGPVIKDEAFAAASEF